MKLRQFKTADILFIIQAVLHFTCQNVYSTFVFSRFIGREIKTVAILIP